MSMHGSDATGTHDERALERRDLSLALALTLGLALVYAALAQDTLYGDAESMVRSFAPREGEGALWQHTLLPLAGRALTALGLGATPFATLRAVAIAAGAVGVAATFLLARGLGARRALALPAALLLAFAPSWTFFATTVEVHVLHAACFAVAACAVVFAPWQRPALAVLVSALAFPLVALSHQTGPILGAGLLALAQVGRERRGLAPLSLGVLCLGVGPAFLAVLLASFAWNARLSGLALADVVGDKVALAEHYYTPASVATFVDLWLAPLGLLLPLALAGVLAGAVAGWRLAALAATALPSMLLFTSWGVTEVGGYALPSATVFAAAGALLFSRARPSARPRRIAWALVAVHALLALAQLERYVGPRWDAYTRGRAEVVGEVLGTPCVLYALNYRFLGIEPDLAGAREVNLYMDVYAAYQAGTSPADFARDVCARIESELAQGASVGLDLSYRDVLVSGRDWQMDYMEALVARLEERLWLQRVEHPFWPLARLRARP